MLVVFFFLIFLLLMDFRTHQRDCVDSIKFHQCKRSESLKHKQLLLICRKGICIK